MSDHQIKIPHIECFVLGPWQTNCYIVTNTQNASKNCWIVDAGFDPEPMLNFINTRELKPVRLIFTHAHVDHIGGAQKIIDMLDYKISIAIHKAEVDFLTDPSLNLSAFLENPVIAPAATEQLDDGAELELDGSFWKIIHTPGHSPGGITLYHQESAQALVGDTLFAGSIGRYDFPTSNGATLAYSIKERLLTLPDNTTIYPGHGTASTIGHERTTNPFLQDNFSFE